MLSVSATRAIADTLRSALPLADTLAGAASELRTALGARGIALVVRRDGRAMRGQAGALDDDPRAISLSDADVDADATLLVSGGVHVPHHVVLVLSLALTARFLAESAQTDGLTGVANRRTFDAALREEWLRAARESAPLALAIPHPVAKGGRLTVSAGVAATVPAHDQSPDALLEAADRELYRAKAEGRDRAPADGYASADEPGPALPQPFSALVGRDVDVDAVDAA